jgi:hypothetical protein
MSKDGGEVPTRTDFHYATPRGPKNMGSGVGSMADIYKVGSQGPVPCDNSESGSPGALNTSVFGDGFDQDDVGGKDSEG